jgi:hypothetical protein
VEPTAVAAELIAAFSAADFDRMRAVLAANVTAFITTGDGGVVEIEGREPLLERIDAMDLESATFTVELTQPPVEVDSDRALAMVEIHAERGGAILHNFAAHLLRVGDSGIDEWRMVDAKPAESDLFWS